MNEIDQILSNIDKDDDDLFPEQGTDVKRNDEISKLIEALDTSDTKNEGAPDNETNDNDVNGNKNANSVPASYGDASAAAPEQDKQEEPKELESSYRGIFSLRGTKTWNRREPYIIQIDDDGYRNDVESLTKAFYFVEGPSDNEDIKQKIKQEIVTFLRRPTDHVTESYTDFICKRISIMVQTLSDSFKLEPDMEKIFIYHIGPQTVCKYLKEDFSQNKYGYCYKYLPGNKAARFFPDEFIKEIVLKWFEQNINTLSLPFDSIHKYEEMKKIATRKYYNDLRIFNTRLEQLNSKLGAEKSISRIKLFQLKGSQWFGHLNVEIYRRFLGGTIFM